MRILRVEKWLLGAALVACGLASGGGARAAEEGAPASDTPKKDKPAGESATKEEEEPPLSLGIDAVIGSSNATQITQSAPGGSFVQNGPAVLSYSTPRVTTQSFVLSAGWKASPGFELGILVPIVSGEIHAAAYQRGTVGFGNTELEAEGTINLASNLDLQLALGVALPTASGSEFDPEHPVVGTPGGSIDQSAYNRFTIQRAVAMARGYESDALFEPQHLGIIPKIKLVWGEREKWHIDPWVKLENLIGIKDGLEHSYVGELVFGATAGYFVTKHVEPALWIWANAPLSGAEFTTVAVVEPQMRFHIGDFMPLAGVILPIAGPLTNPYAVGVRLAAGGRF